MKSENDNKMYFIAILFPREILKSRICEKIIANCEEWYRKVGSRICEIANCEDLELRGIPEWMNECLFYKALHSSISIIIRVNGNSGTMMQLVLEGVKCVPESS